MNRGAHGDSSLMLSTLVLSNENRQLADRREEAPTSSGGGGCHAEDIEKICYNNLMEKTSEMNTSKGVICHE